MKVEEINGGVAAGLIETAIDYLDLRIKEGTLCVSTTEASAERALKKIMECVDLRLSYKRKASRIMPVIELVIDAGFYAFATYKIRDLIVQTRKYTEDEETDVYIEAMEATVAQLQNEIRRLRKRRV